MIGKQAGDQVAVTISPEQAYGERHEGMTQRIPKKLFKNARLAPGMQVVLPTEMGQRAMTVLKVGMSVVDVDLNHPMAGKSLDFAVDVIEVRAGSEEENRAWPCARRRRRAALSLWPMARPALLNYSKVFAGTPP